MFRFKNVITPGCHGKWVKTAVYDKCPCQGINVLMYSCTPVLIYSCTHALMYSCIYVLMNSCTHVFMYKFTHVFMYKFTHVLMYSSTHVLISRDGLHLCLELSSQSR